MYRTICAELWTDPEIKSLTVPTKLLFLYLITNPHTHLCGIYYLPEETILRESGLKQIPYQYGMDTLSRLEKAHYDPHTETVFVVNMFEYQGKGSKNHIAAANHLETLHNSHLISQFILRYPHIPYRYPINTVSNISPSVPISNTVSSPSSPNPDLKSNSHSKKSVSRAILDSDQPCEKHVKLAEAWQLNLGFEWQKFKHYCLAHDKRYVNFEAAFRNWLANAKEKLHALR